MKNGSGQYDVLIVTNFCSMCGATEDDAWETRQNLRCRLRLRPRTGDPGHSWTLCDECWEGLTGLSDQEAVLDWLLAKFKSKRP